MFEAAAPERPGTAARAVERSMDAARVAEWKDTLAAELEGLTVGTDDAELIDLIRSCEELKSVAAAAQARATVAFDAAQRSAAAKRGTPADRRGRGIAAQVGLARRVSHHQAGRLLGFAKVLHAELPHTQEAFDAGLLTEWRAMLIARETACLSVEHRLEVDRRVAGDPRRVSAMGDREIASEARRAAVELDAGAVAKRRRRAESERNVTCRPAPDSMTYLTGHLPVAQGVAVHVALGKQADALKAGGDPRSRGQIMADTLVDRVLHPGASTSAPDPTRWDATPPGSDASTPAAPVRINLVMTDRTLLAQGDEAAHVEGYGPVPADLARDLATSGADRTRTWLRRLYADPTSGELVAMDSHQRLFPSRLAELIRLRDQARCRMPWCDAPVRHLDHPDSVAAGGETSYLNGQGLCEACNHAKQADRWAAHPVRGPSGRHEVVTTTPTGHRYTSHAPPVITRRPRARPLVVEYHHHRSPALDLDLAG